MAAPTIPPDISFCRELYKHMSSHRSPGDDQLFAAATGYLVAYVATLTAERADREPKDASPAETAKV